MPYRLKKSESVPEGLRRIVGEELSSAIEELKNSKKREQGIHEARKTVKKIRGILRLVQSHLGQAYQVENRRFRNIGRKLSALRDAASIIEAFDALLEKHKASLRPGAFSGIHQYLRRSKHETEQSLDVEKTTAQAVSAFNTASKTVTGWPLDAHGFSALETGLHTGYQNGRKMFNRATNSDSAVVFHEFRKAVKTHWYHVRLLEGLTKEMESRQERLKELETLLGDDHNLAVLNEKLESHPETTADREEFKLFVGLLSQEQTELRTKSLKLGAELYSDKPHAFVAHLSSLWHAWHQHVRAGAGPERSHDRQGVAVPKRGASMKQQAKPKAKTAVA